MKYMTFNSACSYAGVANMLERYGVETDDRTIAMEMKLPYLFACEDGVYMAGPMLQRADWFNLYLGPIGYRMVETEVAAEQAADFLKKQKTAMLGLRVHGNHKHAVVYTGHRAGQLVFLNNKWAGEPGQEQFLLPEAELPQYLGPSAVIAVLEPTTAKSVDLTAIIRQSIPVIRQNLAQIRAVCGTQERVGELRSKLNTLFRPLLLDGITMLELLGETDLARRFSALQHRFLTALRQDPAVRIRLGEHLSMPDLCAAAEDYIQLIERELADLSASCDGRQSTFLRAGSGTPECP